MLESSSDEDGGDAIAKNSGLASSLSFSFNWMYCPGTVYPSITSDETSTVT